MKPHELLWGLMASEGIAGALPLAKKLKRVTLQPAWHRYLDGKVKEPKRPTMEPLSAHFKVPLDAFYDERIATKVARERNIPDRPPQVAAKRARKLRGQPDASTLELAVRIQAIGDDTIKAKIAELLNGGSNGKRTGTRG